MGRGRKSRQQAVIKASIYGGDPGTTRVLTDDARHRQFQRIGALVPPYDPVDLSHMYERSHALRPNIDAYKTNIEGFGWRLEETIDLEGKDANEKIRESIRLEKAFDEQTPTVSDDEVAARLEEIKASRMLERLQLELFFEGVSAGDMSFVSLRECTRTDLEVTGNGYWEVVRNRGGMVDQINYAAATNTRLMPQALSPITVEVKRKVSPVAYRSVPRRRRFRRYVQELEGLPVIYFKQFGDKRVMSAATGKYYDSEGEGKRVESGKWLMATEMIHFRLHSPLSAYGVPRWIGTTPAVLGTRAADEVNLLYFDNKAVPPLAVMVSGGALAKGAVQRLKNYVRDTLRGRENFHSILVLEAESAPVAAGAQPPRIRIELKPLREAQQQDALFLEYDERNTEKIGSMFRLPRMLRGDIRDFNRACYDDKTETLTRRGWLRLDEFTDDDEVAAYRPDTDRIEYVRPAALRVYEVDEELLHFQSAVADIMVTEDHRMLARSFNDERFSVHPSQSIPWSRYALKTTVGGAGGTAIDEFRLPRDHACQIERGHNHASSVPGNAFVAFVGYWLSEGSLLSTDHPSAPYIVTLSQRDGRVAADIRSCLQRTGWAFSESLDEVTGMCRWTLSNRCLSAWLREHCGGGAAVKRIPAIAHDLDPEQSRILFASMMDGDGHWDPRPNRESGYYASTSRDLANDFQAIAVRLGYRAAMSMHYPAHGNRVACWRVSVSKGRDAEFREEPKRVHYQGRVYCFSVPEHGFYVTRRNGKVAVQGNTADAALRFAEQQVFDPERKKVDHVINELLLSELDIRFWRFVSGSPIAKDPAEQSKMIHEQREFLLPQEARKLIGPLFGTELKELDGDWTKLPFPVLQARLQAGLPGTEGEQTDANVMNALVSLRNALDTKSAEEAEVEEDILDVNDAMPREVIKLAPEDFFSLFEDGAEMLKAWNGGRRRRRRRRKAEQAADAKALDRTG